MGYRSYYRRRSLVAQLLVIIILMDVLMPVLCVIPGLRGLMADIADELINESSLLAWWVSRLAGYIGRGGVAEQVIRGQLGVTAATGVMGEALLASVLDMAVESIAIGFAAAVATSVADVVSPDSVHILSCVIGVVVGIALFGIIDAAAYVGLILLGIWLMVGAVFPRILPFFGRRRKSLLSMIAEVALGALAGSALLCYAAAMEALIGGALGLFRSIVFGFIMTALVFLLAFLMYVLKKIEKREDDARR